MSRRKTIIFSIILLAICFVLATNPERVQRGDETYTVEYKFDLGDGRTILILLKEEYFEIPSWAYEIHVNGEMVVPTTHLQGCCGSHPQFKIVWSCDKRIVGLVRTDNFGLLIAHDFVSGATWPRGRAETLRQILQEDNPDTKFEIRP